MARAIVLLLLCHGLMAQGQPPPDASSLARVEGRVLNSATGEPLRKSELILHGMVTRGANGANAGGEYSATSDANGHFVIERISPGTYTLTAQHQNFGVLDYGAVRSGTPGKRFALTAGQSMTSIEMKMVPFGVISGKVVDQDGDPVTGVPVTVMHWGFMRGGRQLQPAGAGTSTNDRGEYRLYNLAAGRYFVSARPIRYEMPPPDVAGRPQGRETNMTTFYPSAPDATTASPVVLTAGQEIPGVDIQLRKTRTFTVQGKIAGFQQGRHYSLSIQPQGAASSGTLTSGRAAAVRPDDGSFVFRGVAPGTYTVIAVADNKVGAKQEISIGDGDLDGLVINITDPGSIKGRAQLEASVGKPPSLRGLRISLAPVDAIPMNIPNASTAEDGSFSMDEVSADRYRVMCSPLESAYLKIIRWNGHISTDGVVEMTSGGTATLELVFAGTTAQIEGDVKVGDDPAPATSVLLMPASMRETDFRITLTDPNGHFVAKGIAPGSYAVMATNASIFSLPDAALMRGLQKVTTQVNVEENGHATVSLTVVPDAVIEAAQ